MTAETENNTQEKKPSNNQILNIDKSFRVCESDPYNLYGLFKKYLDSNNTSIENYQGELNWIADTLNLINHLHECSYDPTSQIYDPVTMVFLDKSGRNSSFVLRELIKLLKEKDILPKEFVEPNYRFLNTYRPDSDGQENKDLQNNPEIVELLKQQLRYDYIPTDIVFVVDDFIDTGYSINNAVSVINNSFNNKKIYATSHFRSSPNWYLVKDLKGVQDFDSSLYDSNSYEYKKHIGGYLSVPLDNNETRKKVLEFRKFLKSELTKFVKIGVSH